MCRRTTPRRRRHDLKTAFALGLLLLALAGCGGPPLGGSPPAKPAKTWFAPCPSLAGTYELASPPQDAVPVLQRVHGAWAPQPAAPWDELAVDAVGEGALRFTWRRSTLPDASVVLGVAPEALARRRWSNGPDEHSDDEFLQLLMTTDGLVGNRITRVVERKQMNCGNGWLAVPHAPGAPDWPAGRDRGAQFTRDREGGLVADFPVHVSGHGFFSPSPLWCGHACRDILGGGHDEHEWVRAPRKPPASPPTRSLEAPYDDGQDPLGNAPTTSEEVRAAWARRLRGPRWFGATLTQLRTSGGMVEMSFSADASPTLVTATIAMRQVAGLRNVVVRRFGGVMAVPQTLVVTAEADPALLAAVR